MRPIKDAEAVTLKRSVRQVARDLVEALGDHAAESVCEDVAMYFDMDVADREGPRERAALAFWHEVYEQVEELTDAHEAQKIATDAAKGEN